MRLRPRSEPARQRTAPFVSKAIGVPLPKLAAKIMAGKTLQELGFTQEIVPKHFSVKEAVFPFIRFPGIDIVLGPEMKSTGEVMGIDADLGLAFAKAQMAAQPPLPAKGNIFISVADSDKQRVIPTRARLRRTSASASIADQRHRRRIGRGRHPGEEALQAQRRPPERARHDQERRAHSHHQHAERQRSPREDEVKIRSTRAANRIPIITTLRAAQASLEGIRALQRGGFNVKSLQEYHPRPWVQSPAAGTAATTTHQRKQKDGADGGDNERAETAKSIRKEGEHTAVSQRG